MLNSITLTENKPLEEYMLPKLLTIVRVKKSLTNL